MIKKYLDTGCYVCGVFIDLPKVFDTVNHYIPLEKLEHYHICGLGNSWLRSFPRIVKVCFSPMEFLLASKQSLAVLLKDLLRSSIVSSIH